MSVRGVEARRSRWPIAVGLGVVVGVIAWLSRGAATPSGPATEAPAEGATVVGAIPRGAPAPTLELRLGALAAISGTVTGPDGAPVAGAKVCAVPELARLTSADVARPYCAASERDGHYRVEGLFPVRHRVHASAPGLAPARHWRGEGAARRDLVDLRPGLEARGVDVQLKGDGVEIHGVVKDLSGGAVEGAQVAAEDAFGVSGTDGAFSLWVPKGYAWLMALADGYAMGRDDGVAPGHAFEIFLTPESVLVGAVVRADDGAPMAGMRVSSGRGGIVALSDAEGKFRLEGLEPGGYKPRVESDDATGMADETVILGLGETSSPVVIKAHPAFVVEGRVVIEGGAGCDDGGVLLHDRGSGRRARAATESGGLVRVRGVLPGDYEISVVCTGAIEPEKRDRVVVADRSVSGLVWTLERGQAIRGVVVDAAGRPIAKVRVTAQPRPDPSDARARVTGSWGVATDEAGRFELAGLLPAVYEVRVNGAEPPRATPPEPTAVTLPKGQDVDGVRIALPATGEVRGRVRDEGGRAVGDVMVSLSGSGWGQVVMTADDGAFVMPFVAPGAYRATARRSWAVNMRAPGSSDDDVQGAKVEVEVGRTAEVELLVESTAGVLTGTVRDRGGAAVSDAFIEATRESDSAAKASGGALRDGRWGSYWEKPHLTDQDGRFTLTGLPTGTYTIRAHRKGGGEGFREHVALGGDVEVTITEAGRMSGTVAVRGGGAAPEEFSVRIEDEATGLRRSDTFFRTDAAWTFAELPAGTYKVSVSAGAGTAVATATMREGEDTSGVRVELAPMITIRGVVVDLAGAPVAGVSVAAQGTGVWAGGDDERRNVTDAQGRFEVARVPTGAVQLRAWPIGALARSYEAASVPVRLSDAATIEVPPIVLAPKRVADGAVYGDRGYRLKESEPGADPLTSRAIVAVVRAGGPAAAAGLQVGDEIVSVDGHDVRGPRAYLHEALTWGRPGAAIVLGLARGESVRVVLGDPP